ncbi:hypothetical protein EJB05_09478, partial [Eragrostis curvula]
MSHVRSFTLFGHPVRISLLPSTVLRVLDLGYCGGMKANHLAGIEKMVHLKYLRLCSDSITRLPEKIEELQHLQTLDVRETGIRELPPTITRLQRLTHLYVNSRTAFPEGVIGQMHSLEELGDYAVSFKHGNSFQELSMLTKLRTLRIGFSFGFRYMPETSQRIPIYDVGTLLSTSLSLHNLSISGASGLPLSLSSWNPTAAPCSLRELCLEDTLIYEVPSWMGTFGNLGVLKLEILYLASWWGMAGRRGPLLVVGNGGAGGRGGAGAAARRRGWTRQQLVYVGQASQQQGVAAPCRRWPGSSSRARQTLVDGSSRATGSSSSGGGEPWQNSGSSSSSSGHGSSSLQLVAVEFEAGSMPKLEQLVYEFPMHKMECRDGVCKLGIQNLPSLSKVEVQIIDVHFRHGRLYDPAEDTDGSVLWVENVIEAAVEALPNRPDIRVQTGPGRICRHFKLQWEEVFVRHSELSESQRSEIIRQAELWLARAGQASITSSVDANGDEVEVELGLGAAAVPQVAAGEDAPAVASTRRVPAAVPAPAPAGGGLISTALDAATAPDVGAVPAAPTDRHHGGRELRLHDHGLMNLADASELAEACGVPPAEIGALSAAAPSVASAEM